VPVRENLSAMKKYICILIAVLSLAGCRKTEESVSTCDNLNYRQALSDYVKRYCSQVVVEYYVLNDPEPVDAYFGTKDFQKEYGSNAKFQAVLDKIYAQIDSVSDFEVHAANKGATCGYEGAWTMSNSDWRISGRFVYEVAPNQPEYKFWRMETPEFIAALDNYILRRFFAAMK
jgi:hypothetical protein